MVKQTQPIEKDCTAEGKKIAVSVVETLAYAMYDLLGSCGSVEPEGAARNTMTRQAAYKTWKILEAQILHWIDAGADPDVAAHATLARTGSARILDRMAIQSETFTMMETSLPDILRATSPEYYRQMVRVGMRIGPALFRLIDAAAEDERYLPDLLDGCTKALATTGATPGAWETTSTFTPGKSHLMLQALRLQIEHFPEHFARMAAEMKAKRKKVSVILVLMMCGANVMVPYAQQAQNDWMRRVGAENDRMRLFLAKIESAHGRLEVHAHFSPIEDHIDVLQSSLDAYLYSIGARSD